MAFSSTQIRQVESTLILWLASHRPEEEIRDKVDFGYTIKGQDIHLEEVRPIYDLLSAKMRNPFAKIKFMQASNTWKIYWMRGNLKWYLYEPKPETATLDEALEEIMNDSHHCFFG